MLNNFEPMHRTGMAASMVKGFLRGIFLVVLSVISASAVLAQDTAKKAPMEMVKDTIEKFPKMVLVQLRTEQNRIKAIAKTGTRQLQEEIKQDAAGEKNATILDFADHFNFCPVYYFADTNLEKIEKQDFDGMLLNADGSRANVAIKKGSTDYVIVYYGYLSEKYTHRLTSEDSLRHATDAEVPMGKGLVIANTHYQVVTYFAKLDYENFMFTLRKKNKKYVYLSKHFDIEYFPFAKIFNAKLKGEPWRSALLLNSLKYIINGDDTKKDVPKKN